MTFDQFFDQTQQAAAEGTSTAAVVKFDTTQGGIPGTPRSAAYQPGVLAYTPGKWIRAFGNAWFFEPAFFSGAVFLISGQEVWIASIQIQGSHHSPFGTSPGIVQIKALTAPNGFPQPNGETYVYIGVKPDDQNLIGGILDQEVSGKSSVFQINRSQDASPVLGGVITLGP